MQTFKHENKILDVHTGNEANKLFTSTSTSNTTFHNDGTTSMQIGNSSFHSDGSYTMKIGSSLITNGKTVFIKKQKQANRLDSAIGLDRSTTKKEPDLKENINRIMYFF